MRRTLLAVLVFCLLPLIVGCGHPMQRKLEGRWLGQAVENFDDEHIAKATGWAKGVTMEFAGSVMTVTIPAEEPRSGTYEVARAHGQDVHLKVLREGGGTDSLHFLFDDERSVRWKLKDGRAIVMHREE